MTLRSSEIFNTFEWSEMAAIAPLGQVGDLPVDDRQLAAHAAAALLNAAATSDSDERSTALMMTCEKPDDLAAAFCASGPILRPCANAEAVNPCDDAEREHEPHHGASLRHLKTLLDVPVAPANT
jgi:hypothetical protein